MISEEELRLALRPHRADPEAFEVAVRARVNEQTWRERARPATMPGPLQSAASLLPLEVLTAGQATGAAVKSGPIVGMFSRLIAYAALPAISLFVLLGATVFGVSTIRKIQTDGSAAPMDEADLRAITEQWWRDHWWAALVILVATVALSWIGATWLLFWAYIVSTSILLSILKRFARIGIGNRLVVGQSCLMGLTLLGQVAVSAGMGDSDIHLVDQALLAPLFFAGALVVELVSTPFNRARWREAWRVGSFAIVLVPLAIWLMSPILWPATPERIRAYVESFDRAEFSSASWREWSIVASWAVKLSPAPDFSRPRRLLADEIYKHDPTLSAILNSAFKVGLVQGDEAGRLEGYEMQLRRLLDQPASDRISLGYDDWVIRAAALRGDVTPEQRDRLAARLHVTLRWSLTRGELASLEYPLRATQLLEVLSRPVNPADYRNDVHRLLKRLHHETGGGFRRAGGFMVFEKVRAGDLDATSDAIELMDVYGVPPDLDLNWDRSFLRPSALVPSPPKWIAAVTLDRLNRLPDVPHPSWWEALYFERSFFAAAVLIGLCIYATAISPPRG